MGHSVRRAASDRVDGPRATGEWRMANGDWRQEEQLFGKLVKGGLVKVGMKDGELDLRIHEPEQPRIGKGKKQPLLTAD